MRTKDFFITVYVDLKLIFSQSSDKGGEGLENIGKVIFDTLSLMVTLYQKKQKKKEINSKNVNLRKEIGSISASQVKNIHIDICLYIESSVEMLYSK